MYHSDEHYLNCLRGILDEVERGNINNVTDITSFGCKDTFSSIGLCAKKYKNKEIKYFKDYHFCPFDLRVKLFISNTYVDYLGMFNGCFYSCESVHKGYTELNTMSLKERIELLITLVESGKAEKMIRNRYYESGNKNKKMNRRLRSLKCKN